MAELYVRKDGEYHKLGYVSEGDVKVMSPLRSILQLTREEIEEGLRRIQNKEYLIMMNPVDAENLGRYIPREYAVQSSVHVERGKSYLFTREDLEGWL